jgi:hypothetical protein
VTAFSYFIIRHKPTGHVITPAKGRNGRGGSHVEPSDGRPKLFDTERAAKGWLTSWLKGRVTEHWSPDPDVDMRLVVTPVATRKRDEMEIAKVELSI